MHAGPTALNLAIPPGEGNAEVVSEITLAARRASLTYAQPHMHLRGKDFELRHRVPPTTSDTTVLKGTWNFELAAGAISSPERSPLPKGTPPAVHHALRQLDGQPVQPGSDGESAVGSPELDEMSNCFIGVLFSPRHQALSTCS